jgi:G3E family GTPase
MLKYTVLSGFLGSGKTTLLRRALAAHAEGEVAVIVNELAPSGVDAHLIGDACAATVEIAGGCACCDKRPELVDAMRRLLDGHERGRLGSLKHVVVETSGLADPLPIVVAVATDAVLRHHFELSSVVTVVDGLCDPGLSEHPEFNRQVMGADRLLISKTDLATPAQVQALEGRLSRQPGTLERTSDAWRTLLDRPRTGGVMRSIQPPDETAHQHTPGIVSTSLNVDGALDWTASGVWLTMLLHAHGQRVLRIKGVVNPEGLGPISINAVQWVLHRPEHVGSMPDDGPALVVIAQGLRADLISRSLLAFQQIA